MRVDDVGPDDEAGEGGDRASVPDGVRAVGDGHGDHGGVLREVEGLGDLGRAGDDDGVAGPGEQRREALDVATDAPGAGPQGEQHPHP